MVQLQLLFGQLNHLSFSDDLVDCIHCIVGVRGREQNVLNRVLWHFLEKLLVDNLNSLQILLVSEKVIGFVHDQALELTQIDALTSTFKIRLQFTKRRDNNMPVTRASRCEIADFDVAELADFLVHCRNLVGKLADVSQNQNLRFHDGWINTQD